MDTNPEPLTPTVGQDATPAELPVANSVDSTIAEAAPDAPDAGLASTPPAESEITSPGADTTEPAITPLETPVAVVEPAVNMQVEEPAPASGEAQYPAPSIAPEPAIETPAPEPVANEAAATPGVDMGPNGGIREDGQSAEATPAEPEPTMVVEPAASMQVEEPAPASGEAQSVSAPAAESTGMSVMPAQSEAAEVPEEPAQTTEPEVPGPTTVVDNVPAAAEEQKPSFISRLLGLVGI
jgi:hypothetical protein